MTWAEWPAIFHAWASTSSPPCYGRQSIHHSLFYRSYTDGVDSQASEVILTNPPEIESIQYLKRPRLIVLLSLVGHTDTFRKHMRWYCYWERQNLHIKKSGQPPWDQGQPPWDQGPHNFTPSPKPGAQKWKAILGYLAPDGAAQTTRSNSTDPCMVKIFTYCFFKALGFKIVCYTVIANQ